MRLIRQLLVGKRYHLFPTFFLSACLLNAIQAGQWQSSLYSLLGFPEIQTITFTDLNSPNPRFIQARVGYEDIYRKKINQETTLTLAEQNNTARLNWPFRIGNTTQLITAEAGKKIYYFNNLNDQTSLISRCRMTNTLFSTRWAMALRAIHIGAGLEFSRNSVPFTIEITSFPHSEDPRTNQYFFDLLEPTFGRELTSSLHQDKNAYSLWASTPLVNRYRIGFSASYSDFEADGRIRYVNSGQKEALAGARQIDIPVSGTVQFYKLSLMSSQSILRNLSLTVFTDDFTFYVDNNRPSITDFISLGDGDFSRAGMAISTQMAFKTWWFSAGLSTAQYHLNTTLRTPALGFSLLLPISHSAELGLSRSHSFSQQIGCGKRFDWRNFSLHTAILYTHSLYDFWMEGTANLMLGIKSNPLNYPYKYSLHLLDLHSELNWRQDPFGIAYAFRQLIPSGRRLDDSPISFTKKTPGLDYAYRGGQQHQFTLAYYF